MTKPLLLAILAATALSSAALAQSSGTTAGTGTGTGGSMAPAAAPATAPSPSTGANSGSFDGQPMMQGMMNCVSPAPMGGFGSFACYPANGAMGMGMNGTGWHHQMMHSQWGSDDGSFTPNDDYQNRQNDRRKRDSSRVPDRDGDNGSDDNGSGYDNDWRSNGNSSGYDGTGSEDDPNP